MSRLIRKSLLAAGAAAGLALLYGRYIERGRVRLDRFTVEVDRPGLPPQGVTILHLSDLHIREREPVQAVKLARLHRLLADEPYDILALTGDLVHNMAGLPTAAAFLAGLNPCLAAFVVPGNRDYLESSFRALLGTPEERQGLSLAKQTSLAARKIGRVLRRFVRNEGGTAKAHGTLGMRANDVPALLAALAAQGIQPLVNRNVHLVADGLDLWVAGVDDLGNGKPDLPAALAGVPADAPLLLLAHNPDIWLQARAHRADLILSGHTHGGQIRLPLLGSVYRQGTHLGRQRAAGWFEQGQARMFVSRGLGESFPLRLGAPLQAALIRLLPGPGLRPVSDRAATAETEVARSAQALGETGRNKFTLRPVGERDMDALLALYRECEDFLALGPRPYASVEMVRGDLALSAADGGLFCGIYTPGGELAGVVDFTPGSRRDNPQEAHIELLMLAPAYRGLRLGEAVVRATEATIWQAAAVQAIAVEAQVNNPDAIRFWQRMGYRIISGPHPQTDDTTSWYLRKERT